MGFAKNISIFHVAIIATGSVFIAFPDSTHLLAYLGSLTGLLVADFGIVKKPEQVIKDHTQEIKELREELNNLRTALKIGNVIGE